MFAPKVNSIKKKSGKMSGYPPETPEFARTTTKTGHPSAKNGYSIKKPK